MTSRERIRYGDTTIEYEVTRSKRRKKTVQITLAGGGVLVAAPATLPADELQGIVQRRAPWIIGRISEAALEAPPKRFVSGETLPYLGRNVKMVVRPGSGREPTVRFDHWSFRINFPACLDESQRIERIRRDIVKWYRARAADRLTACVDRWCPRLGRGELPQVLIRDQRSRWGSCAPDGTLRFNWRVVMLEPSLIDYVVVHELAHLTVKNHSRDFWDWVSEVMPDMQHRRNRLREAGRTLPL